MSNFFHRLAAIFGLVAASIPAAGAMPAGTPKAVNVGMAVVGVATAILTNLDKIKGAK